MDKKFDFSGWATRNDLRCSDGRTIRRDAFKAQDGETVPLVWQHQHQSPTNFLGHALLENRDEGVYAYCSFNDSPYAQHAKELIRHGDICALSIYANQLRQQGGNVLHGIIREVSLVMAGANPGATIDFPVLEHGEESETEAVIYTGEELFLSHSGDDAPEEKPKDKKGEDKMEDERTIKDVFDSMTEEQQNVVYFMVGQALEGQTGEPDEEETDMKHNVFDNDEQILMHNSIGPEDVKTIMADAKRCGSLRDSVLMHMENGVLAHAVTNADGTEQTYGIADIDYLFPDAKTLTNTPEFIKRENEWVAKVMSGTRHSPFSRVKSIFANITMDEARARGYIKGKMKKEEVFSLLKRSTDPQTIYKKQKLDRDDIIDITGFDVVAWLKGEMRIMLDEELARAVLIGDGRLNSDDDKISEDHIRPIWKDADLYSVKVGVTKGANDSETAKNFIRAAIKARKDYKGSGTPTLFTTEDMLTEMLLLEDTIGHALYDSASALATKLRVKEIVTVPVMENQVNATTNGTLAGIIVNLNDYNIGADKGGAVSMFDDFDIDFNQQKYLIETRCSGALVKPYSALVLEVQGSTSVE